jgi:hypothetical protein
MRINLREKRTEAGWAELWERPYRAICEHTLKIASWSVLVAAVRYLADKSGDWKLKVLDVTLMLALMGYIYSLVVNLNVELFPPDELRSLIRGGHYGQRSCEPRKQIP